jgi:hypothetical protein
MGGFIHFTVKQGSQRDIDTVQSLVNLRSVVKTNGGCKWDLDVLTLYKTPHHSFDSPGDIEIGQVISSHDPHIISFWPKDEASQAMVEFLFECISVLYNQRTAAEWKIVRQFKRMFGIPTKRITNVRINVDSFHYGEPPRIKAIFYSPGAPVS